LRFNNDDSPYLVFDPDTQGTRTTWTWSAWVKFSSADRKVLFAGVTNQISRYFFIEHDANGHLDIFDLTFSTTNSRLRTSREFTDYSAWYHIVFTYDTTNSTADDRHRLYVNGEQIEDFLNRTNPNANHSSHVLSLHPHYLSGYTSTGTLPHDGYMAEVHLIDGQSLQASDFGEYDDNNVWQPKEYEGTYGTHGWHLDFSDATNTTTIAEDSSGNGNDFTANNISVTAGSGNDSLFDSPSNGTQSDTGAGGEVNGNYATLNPLDGSPTGLSNGNLDAASANAYPTIIPGSGQWYYEVNGTGYTWDGTRANFTPRAGSHNFGQRVFSGTAPSGYKSICTANLPDPTIADGSTAMDVALYTGNSSTQTISGLNFSPDLVWIKSRSQTRDHKLVDSVRGVGEELEPNQTTAEVTNSDGLTAFNSDGFSLGADADYNIGSGNTYVAWAWDAGSSTVSNTDGSITANVRANASTGCSIVSFTGTGANATVGHGLNAAPGFMIIKDLGSGTRPWNVYHKSITAEKRLKLNDNTAAGDLASIFNDTEPTSSVFSLGAALAINASGSDIIAYCFAPVEGYSAFGSYTGNGNSDGPFVYTGFRPQYILTKITSGTGDWFIWDDQRPGHNLTNGILNASYNGAEYGTTGSNGVDILSNGFKIRGNATWWNSSSATYVYVAFAAHPFKTARAR